MVTTVCDTLGAPVPHQQVVVVGVIVHTDKDTPVVRIPAYTPLYQHKKNGGFMQTNGIAHVSTAVSDRFVGVALDAFTAVHARGEEGNQMSVAISGLVSAPVPMTELSFNLPSAGASVYADYMTPLYSTPDRKMEYDGEKVPTVTPFTYHLGTEGKDLNSYGRLVQRFSMIEDGGSLLMGCTPSNSFPVTPSSKDDLEKEAEDELKKIEKENSKILFGQEYSDTDDAGEDSSSIDGIFDGVEPPNDETDGGVAPDADRDKAEDGNGDKAKDAANALAQVGNISAKMDGFGEGDAASDMEADVPTMADLSAPKKRQRGNGSTKRQRKKKPAVKESD
jgi:hypothetical protein